MQQSQLTNQSMAPWENATRTNAKNHKWNQEYTQSKEFRFLFANGMIVKLESTLKLSYKTRTKRMTTIQMGAKNPLYFVLKSKAYI